MGVGWDEDSPNATGQERGDPSPAPARQAPPFTGFPDSALLPTRAAGDPRCMCNGGWEQRRAGPSALASAHQPPRPPWSSP